MSTLRTIMRIICDVLYKFIKLMIKVQSMLSEKEWAKFYRGDDGHHTFYIDLVEEKFAKNSIQPREERQDLLDNVSTMLKIIQKGI